MARDFKTIGVVGLGTMGAGITEVFARNGYSVVGVEVDEDGVERGRQHLEHSTARAVARGKLSEDDAKALHDRVSFATSLEELKDADLVVEAVVESLEIKKQIFKQLDGIVAEDAILATNTSSLSVTEISTANSSPGRVIGVHFFNPAPVQGFVEIVRTVVTEPEVLEDVSALVKALGKNPVVCGDKAGFIANTLLFGYLNHAVSMYEHRYASREDIDAAMRFGCGYPMGPLALLDLIGLDTAYEILETMYRQGRDRLHAPGADPQADGHRRHARPEDRQGLLQLRGADSPVVVADDKTPSADDKPAAQARHQARRRRRHRHHGDRHRRGLRQGRVRRHLRRPLAGQGRRRPYDDRALARQGDPARQARGGGQGRRARPAHRHHLARRPRPGRHRGRGDRRGPQDQDHAVREPRRDLQARRDPRDHDVVAADHPVRPGDQPAAGRRRHALLQPGADHEAGRGRLDGLHLRGRHRDHAGAVRASSARSRSPAATARASSSTRCCSPTSTTRSRCSRRTTRPPTTSTPR